MQNKIVFWFFHSCHNLSMEQEMPNQYKYSKPNFKLKNTSQRSTTIPEHESTKYFIAACVLGAAHLIMTFIEKTSSIPLYAHVVMYLRNLPCPITVNNLLYWDDRLRPDINAQIVMSLHNYITSTKRCPRFVLTFKCVLHFFFFLSLLLT